MLSPLGVWGISVWKEGPADFPLGQNLGTATEGQYLVLGPDPSLPGNWTMRADIGAPTARAGHLMVHDSAGSRQILFGGSGGGIRTNDTWTFDPGKGRWTMMEPADAPSPRNGSAMVLLPAEGEFILFGGDDGSDRNDTWGFKPDRLLWYLPAMADSPSPRNGHAMAFDTQTRQAVLFGGRYSSGTAPVECLADTWVFSSNGYRWLNATASGSPLPRYGHAMAYDPAGGLVVMFGGRNDTAFLQDTWTFNTTAATWANRNPPTYPPSRAGHTLAFDAASGDIILFGGEDSSKSYNDTWVYDTSGNTWTRKLLAAGPTARSGQATAADPATGRLVLFGGRDRSGNALDDTWSYDPASNTWSKTDRPASPSPRVHHSLASSGQDALLFGGTDTLRQFNDTWLYNSTQNIWSRVDGPDAPSPRIDHALACDNLAGTALLFGGLAGSDYQNDTWSYNFTTGAWTREFPADTPPPGAGYLLDFDTYVGRFLLFGGRNETDLFADTWTYDPALSSWTNLAPSPSPPPRDDGMMAYDGSRLRTVLFGGSDGTGPLADTWTYFSVTNTWTRLNPLASPPGRADGSMAYDGSSHKVVLFGGLNGTTALNDTWLFGILDNTWTELSPARSPPSRFGHALATNEAGGLLVLFGGLSGGRCRAQTWILGLQGRNTSGTYVSRPCAAGGSAYFGDLSWDSSVPAGSSVRLQLRTAMTEGELADAPFLGPDGTPSTFYTSGNTRLPPVHNGTAHVQYCATLESADVLWTPRLGSVTLNYNLLHTLRLLAPSGGENWTGPRDIAWEVNDSDGNQITVDLYIVDSVGSTPLALNIPASDGAFQWDTTEAPNGTYRIRAVARDDNALIPLSVDAVSPDFVLSHPPGGPPPPPPNHPPVVLLSHPAEGSVVDSSSIRLVWNATDPDGDPLACRVFFEVARFDAALPPEPYCVTSASSLDVTGLTNGQTYYWSVIAGDGRDNGTTGVWHFTVRLEQVNLPPKITSIPPDNATVGVEYVYQVWASDPEGDTMTYSLSRAPAGMAINSTSGRIAWTPLPVQAGNDDVTVNVTDGRLGADSQSFNITVRAPPRVKASVAILHPTDGWRVRGGLRITGLALNGTDAVVSVQVRIDGGPWLPANGTASWTYELSTEHMSNGRHGVEARCFDGNAFSEAEAVSFLLANPEPEPTLDDPMAALVALGLWILAGLPLFWHLRRYPVTSPPMG